MLFSLFTSTSARKTLDKVKRQQAVAEKLNQSLSHKVADAVMDIDELKSQLSSVREECDQIKQAMRALRGESEAAEDGHIIEGGYCKVDERSLSSAADKS